jgi:hypothetical protein
MLVYPGFLNTRRDNISVNEVLLASFPKRPTYPKHSTQSHSTNRKISTMLSVGYLHRRIVASSIFSCDLMSFIIPRRSKWNCEFA